MHVATYWIWWVLAAILVGTELFTGTFYLLAVGCRVCPWVALPPGWGRTRRRTVAHRR